MPPVISIVGRSNSGKTTFIEKLIPALKRRGYKVGVIKHHVHESGMDTPGKDTWRHKASGASVVALASPTSLGIIRDVDADQPLAALAARFFEDVDILLTEGYKHDAMPKIEVFRKTAHTEPLENRDNTWIALAGDFSDSEALPVFSLEDADGVAELIDKTIKTPLHQTKDGFS